MSRITLTIDTLVLKGFDPGDRKAITAALQAELTRVLANRSNRAEWARPHRTPVIRLGRMPIEPGPGGSRKFGTDVARAIGKGLKP